MFRKFLNRFFGKSAAQILSDSLPDWQVTEFEVPNFLGKCYKFQFGDDPNMVTYVRIHSGFLNLTATETARIILSEFPRRRDNMDFSVSVQVSSSIGFKGI